MKGIVDALTSSSQVVIEYDLVSCILGGFGQEYDPLMVTITTKKENITLQDAQCLLMSFESSLEQFATNTFIDLSCTSANIHMKSQRGDASNFQGGNYRRRNKVGKAKQYHQMNMVILRGTESKNAHEAVKHFGPAPGVPNNRSKPYV
ncbi:hypothetical protein Ddye_022889 [Dipteronia dyeriana]|uniref:Uncharacterized protein n=1 Tax=Dipteronia dyeriana TaxID=168575 RepID=A0AAD9TS25_9ROSI|nr:hypothetical protein Ddye_022889 [Dipteronia dyeriana]